MMRKTLGRCSRRHAQVVEYDDSAVPSGVCARTDKDGKPCGEPLIEWALRGGAAAR